MPKLYIEVSGGVVCGVYSNAATEVVLVDHDNIKSNSLTEDTEQDFNLELSDDDKKLLAEFEQDKMSPGFAELAIS